MMVTVDCMRADHVGFMGYHRPTTPFFDSLSADSFIFPAAIVAGTPTYFSLPAIMASRHPLALGRDVVGIAPEELTLAGVMKKAGYATAAFAAANPYIASCFGYDQGFDVFHDFLDSGPSARPAEENRSAPANGWLGKVNQRIQRARSRIGPLGLIYDELYFQYCQRSTPVADSLDELRRFPSAEIVVEQARKWLDSIGSSPVFLWLHLMDPHSPYYPKKQALALLEKDRFTPFEARYVNSHWNRSDLGPRRLARHREEIIALYDAGIRWVDFQIGCLVDYLKASNRWEDCILVVSADHGEEFSDHGGRFHPPSRVTEELIHVPLLLRVPGQEKVVLGNTPFSMLDLAPTLLEIAGVESAPEFQGQSRWAQVRAGKPYESVAITECVADCTNPFRTASRLGPRVLSVRESRFKLVLRFSPPEEQLYDLEADPGEQAPLAPSAQKVVRKRLLEAARLHLQTSIQKRDGRERVRALLRDLQLESARFFPQKAS